jgi:hypothetical protein
MKDEKKLKRCLRCPHLLQNMQIRRVILDGFVNFDPLTEASSPDRATDSLAGMRPIGRVTEGKPTEPPVEITEPVETQASISPVVLRFVDELLIKAPDARLDAASMYRSFCVFWRQYYPGGPLPTVTCLGRSLRFLVKTRQLLDMRKMKSGGLVTYVGYGLRAVPETIAADQ